MNHYMNLVKRYLKLNKNRCIVTMIGVSLATALLYLILNFSWSSLLQTRAEARKETDYEIVLLTETEEQIEQIKADDRVKSVYVGPYYRESTEGSKQYDNALYINLTHPYRMRSALEKMKAQYGVDGVLNMSIAETYMQDDGSIFYIIALTVLLISFIFAIFGIGIVRNSVELFTFEQIKDYGNLRCIGATKRQLKQIIYMEGVILELSGNALGIVIGSILSVLIGKWYHVNAGFHFLPILPILIAFLGDLYFAMRESCKVINHLSPVSAIRGEYRIRKEKIKVRRKSIMGRLFGVEGDYAYKNIMRNPGRFRKTALIFGLGIGVVIATAGVINSVSGILEKNEEQYGYYQIYYRHPLGIDEEIDTVESGLPSADYLQNIADMEEVESAKRLYAADILVADYRNVFGHYTDDLTCELEPWMNRIYESAEEKGLVFTSLSNGIANMEIRGYDEEDFNKLKPALTDGTLDVGEHGLVLVNYGEHLLWSDAEQLENMIDGWQHIQYTDYQVGDTIDLVDMKKYREMVKEKWKPVTEKYQEVLQYEVKTSEDGVDLQPGETRDNFEEKEEYRNEINAVAQECWEQLIASGDYTTYTIEGILDGNPLEYTVGPIFIVPQENYYTISGTDSTMMTGFGYHFNDFSIKKYEQAVSKVNVDYFLDQRDYEASGYVMFEYLLNESWSVLRIVILVVALIILMSSFNIINSTASSLYLRKKEFAQLRVIGVSKRQLIRMLLLEGVVNTVVSSFVGIMLGLLFGGGGTTLVSMGFGIIRFRFPYITAAFCVLVTFCILGGSVYFPMRKMKLNMAEDLTAAGE